jgi:hypothetical protein
MKRKMAKGATKIEVPFVDVTDVRTTIYWLPIEVGHRSAERSDGKAPLPVVASILAVR